MTSFKDNVFRTLALYNAGSLQDIIKIPLGRAVLFAGRRSLGRKLDGVHLHPLYLAASEGHTGTFNTGGALDDVQPRTGAHHPPHESEVAARHSFGWP